MKFFFLGKKILKDVLMNGNCTNPGTSEIKQWVVDLGKREKTPCWLCIYDEQGRRIKEVEPVNSSDIFNNLVDFIHRIGDDVILLPEKEVSDLMKKDRAPIIVYQLVEAAMKAFVTGDFSDLTKLNYGIVHANAEHIEVKKLPERVKVKNPDAGLYIKYVESSTGNVKEFKTDNPEEYMSTLYECLQCILDDTVMNTESDDDEYYNSDLTKLVSTIARSILG